MKTGLLTKGRYIAILWLAPQIYLPGLDQIYGLFVNSDNWYWYDLSYYYYFHYLCSILLIVMTFVDRVKWQPMLKVPKASSWQPAILLTTFIFIFSIAGAYLLFYPLSFIVPNFVNDFYINLPPIVYNSANNFPTVPNILSLLSLVVFAPVIEELTFRGMLLHRWTHKWNKTIAVILSSTLFAVLHSDPIGAFAFGVAMSVLYMKYQTLIVPIVCHGLNNLVVWLMELIDVQDFDTVTSPVYLYTLKEFQSELWLGVLCGAVCFVWGLWYSKHHDLKQTWNRLALPKLV